MAEEKIVSYFEGNATPWMKESIRSLRNKLLLSKLDHEVICVSSFYPKEGVTTIVRILGLYLGDIQKKVLIVSTDLKHKNTEIPDSAYTLKDYLMGNCSYESILLKVNENLNVIIGSDSNEDYSDLLYMSNFAELINQLKSEYDLVLIDAPSFSTAAESIILSQLADSLILVVRENNVKINDFADLYRKLLKQNITIKGVVLNRITETENLEIQVYDK